MLTRWLGLFAIAGAVASCRESPTHPVGCSGDIHVFVDTHTFGSTRPLFSWTPRCGATVVTVVTSPIGVGDPAVMWSVSVPENLPMAPPLMYGSIPTHVTEFTQAQPLSPGQRYRVLVGTTVGGDALTAQGEATFTP
jgi:hypothetical protein